METNITPKLSEILDQMKQKTSELLNLVDMIPDMIGTAHNETGIQPDVKIKRFKALALVEFENGLMWAKRAVEESH